MAFKVPEKYRMKECGPWSSDERSGNNGAFQIRSLKFPKSVICVIASDGGGWEHVSVSIQGAQRCPTWEEMCFVKSLFWGPQDCVVQFHPPESDYVNLHPWCLHLWRKVGQEFSRPPAIYVGPCGSATA